MDRMTQCLDFVAPDPNLELHTLGGGGGYITQECGTPAISPCANFPPRGTQGLILFATAGNEVTKTPSFEAFGIGEFIEFRYGSRPF